MISLTRADRPKPATINSSPGAIAPDTILPEKPRNSAFGRFTHWTGKRNGSSLAPPETSTECRYSTRVGPRYHGIRADRLVTLSPYRADSGIALIEALPKPAANSEKPVAISSKQRSSKATRSILLTA